RVGRNRGEFARTVDQQDDRPIDDTHEQQAAAHVRRFALEAKTWAQIEGWNYLSAHRHDTVRERSTLWFWCCRADHLQLLDVFAAQSVGRTRKLKKNEAAAVCGHANLNFRCCACCTRPPASRMSATVPSLSSVAPAMPGTATRGSATGRTTISR